jgi:acetyl-CoA acetyltransferase
MIRYAFSPSGFFDAGIVPVTITQKKGDPIALGHPLGASGARHATTAVSR